MVKLKEHYSIKVVSPEGFSKIIPCNFMFKRSAITFAENQRTVHPRYKYEIIDNIKGIKLIR